MGDFVWQFCWASKEALGMRPASHSRPSQILSYTLGTIKCRVQTENSGARPNIMQVADISAVRITIAEILRDSHLSADPRDPEADCFLLPLMSVQQL